MMWKAFNFNKTNSDYSNQKGSEVLERAKIYFTKMETRCEELMNQVQESAQLLADADQDPYKRSYLQFKSAIIAQFTGIIQKGSQTYQFQIMPKAKDFDFIALSQLFTAWQSKVVKLMEDSFKDVLERNLEKEYLDIMQEYDRIRNNFQCEVCGASLEIDRFYHTASYFTCNFCQSQNTFDPGDKARLVEHMAIPLARARCMDKYELYREKKMAQGQGAARLEYENYVKALIVQMNEILPGNQEQNQNYYCRLMNDYDKIMVPW